MRQISYSPLMAESLSYLESKSSAYVWERYRLKAQADENFAREIMQLFSIGILKLNMDGSPKLDEEGETELAYSNDDIMSFSRAWTGFDLQPRRGNVEGANNRLDPMDIVPAWRDQFPKTDLNGGYLGDRYPLCADLPKKAFLKKGATFRFLGSSPLPELMSDPSNFASMDDSIKRLVLGSSSSLRNKLCNVQNGECRYENKVILDSTLECDGSECDADTVRVVQIEASVYYEYVRLPCVDNVFFNESVKISQRGGGGNKLVMCANPNLPYASEACCAVGRKIASRNSLYDGERMRLSHAKDRCERISQVLCDFEKVKGNRYLNSNYFWTSEDCSLQVKIKSDGMVTVVHQVPDPADLVPHVDESNENFFKVYWESNQYPTAADGCGLCQIMADSCLCDIRVLRETVYREAPESIEDVLGDLYIGAVDPNIFGNNYSSSIDSDTGITTHIKNGIFNEDTVFELKDDWDRSFHLKNVKETVIIDGVGGANFKFRNAPQFMSFVPSETTKR